MKKLKARGSQGSWFARIEGEDIPGVWKRRVQKWPRYHDPEARYDQTKWEKYVAAIEQIKRVALTDEKEDETGKWQRKGYVALYEVKDVKCDDSGLQFEFSSRLADLE